METWLSFDGYLLEHQLQVLADSSIQSCGLWRASYTEEDRIARKILNNWFAENDFSSVYTDPVGNQYGHLNGQLGKGKTVLIGSHFDTVKNAGMYDGTVGILLGTYAVGALFHRFGLPKLNVEVGAFVEEEGSRFPAVSYLGSRAVNGQFSREELKYTDEAGISLEKAATAAGYPIHRFSSAVRNDLLCYIEPHVEQGGILEHFGVQVGIVEAITGFALLTIHVFGQADHAGTTPMLMRHDALQAAADIIHRLPTLIPKSHPNDTITVGSISAEPGSSNVVPQLVRFTIDIRSTDSDHLEYMISKITQLCNTQAVVYQCSAEVRCDLHIQPVWLNSELCEMTKTCCEELALTYRQLPSGAGHDCMNFASRVPSTMFFLPSKGGRSHCPEEYTSPEQLAYGANLLSRLLYKLAWK